MEYYFSKTLNLSFEQAIQAVVEALRAKGFGVLTTIDVSETLRLKLNVEFPPYTILGACNPHMAYQALQKEPRIGTMLPCNVIVRQVQANKVEVSAVDPVASMQAVRNEVLGTVAVQVRNMLQEVVAAL